VFSLEYVDVPFVVSYTPNLSANAPVGLPTPNQVATYAAGFAPFYSTSAATLASSSLPVPRFVFSGTPTPLFGIVKCSCNMLFPWVTQAPGYDTGIAIANTTADPYGTANHNGSTQWGLDNRGAGFSGYLIAQAQFQFCHAFAFISGLGAGPTTGNGLSEGYLALILDPWTLTARGVPGENLGN
jgi:hypothetical protein